MDGCEVVGEQSSIVSSRLLVRRCGQKQRVVLLHSPASIIILAHPSVTQSILIKLSRIIYSKQRQASSSSTLRFYDFMLNMIE